MIKRQYECLSKCWIRWVIWGASLLFAIQTPLLGDEKLQRFEFLQIRMGVPVKIVLYAGSESIANQASAAAYRRIREIDRIMSDYDPDSELMKLCQDAVPGEQVSVSDELFKVLLAAQHLSCETDGAFDVTVGPLVKLWRIARRRRELPATDRLDVARNLVGYKAVKLHPTARTVELQKPGMQLDLGAIAKGYAADVAVQAMADLGVKSVLVDAGGDIVVGDPPPERSHWIVTVEKLAHRHQSEPTNEKPGPAPRVRLKNQAIATSGDVYQYLEIDGVRYSHIVNPKTGLGITRSSTVTVIAPTGMQADSLASAVSVLGGPDGRKFVDSLKAVEVLVVQMGEDDLIEEYVTPGFEDYLLQE